METIDYIDAYFQQRLNENERKEFEQRCVNDDIFAKEVAFYVTARQAARDALLKEKQAEWKTEESNKREDLFFIKPFRRIKDFKWKYAAAAIIILTLGTYFFETQTSPQHLADKYVKTNFSRLDLMMDGTKDSMQTAISYYNNKKYTEALSIFIGVYQTHPENNYALEYSGKTYLMKKNYDNALQQFDALAKKKGLFSNPGVFYKAITLLERNKSGDKDAAKILLQNVVIQNLEHAKEAQQWLKKF